MREVIGTLFGSSWQTRNRGKLTRLLAIATTLLSISAHGWEPNAKYEFMLRYGEGVAVCDAYLERLRQTVFERPPYCDRPESDSVPGFALLNRVPLTTEEIIRLTDPISGFIRARDVDWVTKRRDSEKEWRIRSGLPPSKGDGPSFAKEEASWLGVGQMHYYRFDPQVDIDNDGQPDHLVVWKGRQPSPVCGAEFRGYPAPTTTHIVALDSEGAVDAKRTSLIFGHPAGNALQYRDKKTGKYKAKEYEYAGFRGIGDEFGVFSYKGATYFDTFYLNGDWHNKGWGEPWLTRTLAVLRHSEGKTERICEIFWTDPDSAATSKTLKGRKK